MLAKPAPNPKFQALTGGYLFGRGVALAATGKVAEAKAALGDLKQLAAVVPADAGAGYNTTRDVLGIAIPIVEARIASAEHRGGDAISLLKDAVAREDKLAYDEPRDWYFPVRHLLGAALLEAKQPAAAEAVYREDLMRNPANGWSLYGLNAALKAQGKPTAEVAHQLHSAWKNADIELTASAF
jgi:hypothetical protein